MAGVMGALYLTARPGSSVMSRTFHPSSGTSSFIPSKTETTFSLTSFGVQHEAINTSTCIQYSPLCRERNDRSLRPCVFPPIDKLLGTDGDLKPLLAPRVHRLDYRR